MTKAEEIIQKYNLVPNSYYKSKKDLEDIDHIKEGQELTSLYQAKWESHISKGWYGLFGLGGPTPKVWFAAIDELLTAIKNDKPHFRILQVKIKYGQARIYLDFIGDDWQIEVQKLEAALSDKFLVY